MTKKELLAKLNALHSQIIDLQDEAVEAWRETNDQDEEEFFSEAGQKLEDMESELSSFISDNTEHEPSEEISDEELDDILEEEMYTEMDGDPEEFFKKNMDSED